MWRRDPQALHYIVFSTPCYNYPFRPNIFLVTLFSNSLSPYFSLSVRDKVAQPYKTTGSIIVLNILVCIRR
jgi:hypothetical protein